MEIERPEYTSRSWHGYLRLHSPRVIIVDNDFKPYGKDRENYFFSLYESFHKRSGHSLRVYATKAGLRVFVTSVMVNKIKNALNVLWELSCDPDYINIGIARDNTFSGRISPKPSNIDKKTNHSFNFYKLNKDQKKKFLEKYNAESPNWASAKFLFSVGNVILPEIKNIINFYDSKTNALTQKPLA